MRALLAISILLTGSAMASSLASSGDIVQFSADPIPAHADPHFADFHVTRADINAVLDTWHTVSGDSWTHDHSHVFGGDRTGTITVKDGRKLKWLVRPGGLAMLTSSDGRKEYLVRGLPKT